LRKLFESFQTNHARGLKPGDHDLVLLDKPGETTINSHLTRLHIDVKEEMGIIWLLFEGLRTRVGWEIVQK
jgi:hypothetical protein